MTWHTDDGIAAQVLAKWRADVTRLLSEESARSRIVESQRGLVSLAHQFLHKCVGFV